MKKQKIFRIQELLSRTLDTDWTVESMAECVELSVSHFRKLFKNETKKSPAKYLRDLRLDRSNELLSDPLNFDPIKKIRYQAGLKNDSHFTHVFKKEYGLTPTEFRELVYAQYQVEIEKDKK